VEDDIATVTVGFAANADTVNNKTYTIGIAGTSSLIAGDATVTITQWKAATSGDITGTVTGGGVALASATVSINKGGTPITATTSADGSYTLASVPFESGYTITVTKTGYNTRTVGGIAVAAGPEPVINFDLLKALTGTVAYDMYFDDLTDGAFSDTGWQFQGNNGSAIEADPDNTGSKVLRLTRSGTFDFVNKTANFISGETFTMEIRAKRTAATYQWALYTNNSATLASNGTSVANIILSGANIGTHANGSNSSTVTTVKALTADTWYKISVVVDPTSNKFDFYVDGEKLLADKPLRNNNPVNYFHFYSSDASGDFILDYFRVYAGQPQ
jgi:hypothetical protein